MVKAVNEKYRQLSSQKKEIYAAKTIWIDAQPH